MLRKDIEDSLLEFLDPDLYGVGQAKSWEALLEEIASGECQIDYSSGKPVRVIEVASIDVIAPDGSRLFEAYQEFSDGRRRERKLWGVSEKFKPGEKSDRSLIRRALKEELGIEGKDILASCFDSKYTVERKESPSYPGLVTEYRKFKAEVKISAEAVKPEYVEIQADKKTVFIWR